MKTEIVYRDSITDYGNEYKFQLLNDGIVIDHINDIGKVILIFKNDSTSFQLSSTDYAAGFTIETSAISVTLGESSIFVGLPLGKFFLTLSAYKSSGSLLDIYAENIPFEIKDGPLPT